LRADFGATHVLRGNLAREGQTLVLSVQLIDTGNGETLWADRLSRPEGDVLSLEEELAQRIIEKLSVAVHTEERKKLARSRASSPEALVLYRQALVMMMPPNDMARILSARRMFQRVQKLDPAFAGGYVGESFSHTITLLFLKAEAPEGELAVALALAEKAISIDPEFGAGHAVLSFALIFSGDLNAAAASARRGVKVQPGSAFTRFMLGVNKVLARKSEEAIVALREATRLDPAEPRTPYLNVLGIALYAAGDYQASLNALEDNTRRGGPEGPHMDIFRAAALAQVGRDDEARSLLDDIAREYPRYDAKKWLANWLVPNGRLNDTLEVLGKLGMR
jgi:Flp pilus assembly protein TadD